MFCMSNPHTWTHIAQKLSRLRRTDLLHVLQRLFGGFILDLLGFWRFSVVGFSSWCPVFSVVDQLLKILAFQWKSWKKCSNPSKSKKKHLPKMSQLCRFGVPYRNRWRSQAPQSKISRKIRKSSFRKHYFFIASLG